MLAVVDNTVLSNLSHVQRPDLLLRLMGRDLATTSEVMLEHTLGQQLGRIPICDWSWLKVSKLSRRQRVLADQLGGTIDRGEATCLALAATRNLIFLTDDRDARRLAQAMKVRISGTLGILIALVNDDYLDLESANRLLAAMIEKGYRSPMQTLEQLNG